MHIALNQLTAHLAKGLRPLYTLHGDEPLLQQEAASTALQSKCAPATTNVVRSV